MNIRDDLYKGQAHSGTLGSFRSAVEEFLGSKVKNSFLLNGPWGVGKTAAIKSLMGETAIQERVKVYSYVSLAGVRELANERSLFLAGIERWDKHRIKEWQDRVEPLGRVVSALAKFFNRGEAVTASVDALMSFGTALFADSLVVLDDIERKHSDLKMEEVVGLIARLSQHKGCRVMVIWNEGELDPDDVKILLKAREKAFDTHFYYSPEVKEAVERVVPSGSNRDRIIRILTPVRVNNLRIIQKTDETLNRIGNELANIGEVSEPVRNSILDNVVRICVFFWCSGHDVTDNRLEGRFSTLMRRNIEKGRTSIQFQSAKEENPLEDMILATSFEKTQVDKVILAFLKTGLLDMKTLNSAAISEQEQQGDPVARAWRDRFEKEMSSSFKPFTAQLLDDAQDLLEKRFGRIGIQTIQMAAIALLRGGRESSVDELEQRWAKNLPIPADGNIGDAASYVHDEEAKRILRDRAAEARKPNPNKGLVNLILAGQLSDGPFLGEPFTNANWLKKELEAVESDHLVDVLTNFYRRLPLAADGTQTQFGKALDAAFDDIGKTSDLNSTRVGRIRRQD
jgi:hypothetical protein